VIAGGAARIILEEAGIHDVLCKSLGSPNAINVARATINGLQSLQRPEEVAARRGLSADEFVPKGMLNAYNDRKKQIAAGETH
jgi:small subunit ribosomal protein S5